MAIKEGENRFTVLVSKDVPASVDTVFCYFDTHAFWEKWWIHTLEVCEGSVGVGETFRIKCENNREDMLYTVSGAFTSIERPKSMVMSWTIEEPHELADETIVTVDFAKSFAGTMVTLRHAGFMSRQAATLHDESWLGGLNKACYFIMRM